MSTLDTPSIYVACLAAYNNGKLHGAWIDATLDVESIHEQIKLMLDASPEPGAEEWALHDYDGFGKIPLSEYEDIEHLHALAVFIEEHEEQGLALLEHTSGDLDEAETALENFAGTYASLADFAQQITEETTEIPENLSFYIDYEKMARDIEINDVFTIEIGFGDVEVYWRR